MLGYVVLGFFGAFGVFCAFWTVVGGFYPGRTECELTLRCHPKQEMLWIRHLCWLRQMGLLRLRLTVENSSLLPEQQQMLTAKFSFIRFL